MTEMAQEYRRKPEIVQAVQWTGENVDELSAFKPNVSHIEAAGQLHIPGANGVIHTAWVGNWVVRGRSGDFYVVGDEEFTDRYEVFEGNL